MMSTMSNKHGDPKKDAGVPRDTLKHALEKETGLQNTPGLKSFKTR